MFVSAATAWEISTKHRLGKLNEATDVCERFHELVMADGFELLPVDAYHALKAGSYRVQHRDPFDRMLAAQTELEGMDLVTRDPSFKLFHTRVFW